MINKLNDTEFQKYFTAPMRLIGEDEKSSRINIRTYVLEILKAEQLKISLDEIEIPYIYVNDHKHFEHILLSYGIKDTFIVIITNTKEIIGYYHLRLKDEYGIK